MITVKPLEKENKGSGPPITFWRCLLCPSIIADNLDRNFVVAEALKHLIGDHAVHQERIIVEPYGPLWIEYLKEEREHGAWNS